MCDINQPDVGKPSVSQVKLWLKYWEYLKKNDPHSVYVRQRDYLDYWFRRFPDNTNVDIVMSKAATLNSLFNVRATAKQLVVFADYILEIDEFDSRLNNGDIDLVNQISDFMSERKESSLYSLTTKYCKFHRPDDYPIYDSNVDNALWCFKKKFWFRNQILNDFYRKDLKKYSKFYNVISLLRNMLKDEGEEFDFTDIDKYLFLAGRKLDKDKASKKQETDKSNAIEGSKVL